MTEDEIKKVYEDLAEYEYQINEHNNKLINSFGKTAMKHFKDMLDYAQVTEKIELVDKPNGEKYNKNYGIFENIYTEEWTVGIEGDSYEGNIYANVKGQWIKVPYTC